MFGSEVLIARMAGPLVRAAAYAGLAALVFGAGYWAGDSHRDDAWRAANAETARLGQQAYAAEVGRGKEAAAALQAELIAKEARDAELDQLRSRVAALGSLTVQRRAPRPVAAPQPAAGDASASAAAPGCLALSDPIPGAAPAPNVGGSADDAAEPRLSLGAVWLWNSALTGTADAPAGACRVDAATGQAAAACADDAGLDLTDAWANQAANARACADDRLRYQRLIEYLQAREQREAD